MNEILVSICCQTYNHVGFIEEAVESFLMQKTDFRFEILIRDDASTDGTTKIVQKYAFKFPELIKLLTYEENQYKKGISPFPDNVRRAQGKYIAICEGDDYWTDPLKLQKQVDYLEENNNCSLVFTNYSVEYDNNEVIINEGISDYSFNGIFKSNPIRTVSTCFRKSYLNDLIHSWPKDYPFLDLALFLYMASKGKIGLINEYTSVYRYHYSSVTHIRDIESKMKFIKMKFKIRNYYIENSKINSDLQNYAITSRLIEGYKSTLIYDLDRKYIDIERNNIKIYKDYNIPFILRILSKNVWLEKTCQYLFKCYFSIKKKKIH